MNRLLRHASLPLAAAALLFAGLPLLVAFIALPAAAIADDDQAVDAANRALEKAVAQDPVGPEMQTDPAFTWVDLTGTLQSRQEILDAFGAGSAPQLVVLTTAVGAQTTARVWTTRVGASARGRQLDRQKHVGEHTAHDPSHLFAPAMATPVVLSARGALLSNPLSNRNQKKCPLAGPKTSERVF